jgi:hypothetical protein
MFDTLRDAKARVMQHAADNLDGTTKRIMAENEAMVAELAYQSGAAERLSRLATEQAAANVHLKRDLSLAEEEVAELFKRTNALTSALRREREKSAAALRDLAAATSALPAGGGVDAPESHASVRSGAAAMGGTLAGASTRKFKHGTLALHEKVRLPAGVKVPPAPPAGATTAQPSAAHVTAGAAADAAALPMAGSDVSAAASFLFDVEVFGGVAHAGDHTAGTGEQPSRSMPLGDAAAVAATLLAGGAGGIPPAAAALHSGGSMADGGAPLAALQAELAASQSELAAARADLDAALDALVVLDSQRLEMLALADDTTLALMRAAAGLRPIIGAAAADALEREAGGAAAAGAGAGGAAFPDAVAALLTDALAAAERGSGFTRMGDSARMRGGSMAGAAAAVAAAVSAAEAALSSARSGGVAGGAGALPRGVGGAEVVAIFRFVTFLSSRMRGYMADLVRALPEPLSVDNLLRIGTAQPAPRSGVPRSRAGVVAGGSVTDDDVLAAASDALVAKFKPQHPQGSDSEGDDEGGGGGSGGGGGADATHHVPRTALEAALARREARAAARAAMPVDDEHVGGEGEAASVQGGGGEEEEGGEGGGRAQAPAAARSPASRTYLPGPRYNAYVHADAGEATVDVPSLAAISLRQPPPGAGGLSRTASRREAAGAEADGYSVRPPTEGATGLLPVVKRPHLYGIKAAHLKPLSTGAPVGGMGGAGGSSPTAAPRAAATVTVAQGSK